MYCRPTSIRFSRGRSTPAMRAIGLSPKRAGPLALALLVTGVGRADDPHGALALDDLALVADLLHRRADLHGLWPPMPLSKDKNTPRDDDRGARRPGASPAPPRPPVFSGLSRKAAPLRAAWEAGPITRAIFPRNRHPSGGPRIALECTEDRRALPSARRTGAGRAHSRRSLPGPGPSAAGRFAWSSHPSGNVRISGPFSVTATVCSKCAERRPSAVTAVQSSSSVRTSPVPAFSIGSRASTMPARSRTPAPGDP